MHEPLSYHTLHRQTQGHSQRQKQQNLTNKTSHRDKQTNTHQGNTPPRRLGCQTKSHVLVYLLSLRHGPSYCKRLNRREGTLQYRKAVGLTPKRPPENVTQADCGNLGRACCSRQNQASLGTSLLFRGCWGMDEGKCTKLKLSGSLISSTFSIDCCTPGALRSGEDSKRFEHRRAPDLLLFPVYTQLSESAQQIWPNTRRRPFVIRLAY